MLLSLELKNFKKHEDILIKFTAGLNLITGPNYSGKSTLLHGILFCMFGVSAVPGGAAIVVRKGAKSVAGNLEFNAHGSLYRLERTKSSAKLFEDGELAASGNSPVAKAMEIVLGMTKKQYMQLQYSQQKQTEALLTVGAAQLNATIEDVSGVDIVNTVLDKCGGIIKTCKGGLDVLSPEVSLDAMDKDITEKNHSLFDMRSEVTRFSGVVDEQAEWVSKVSKLLNAAEVSNAQRETGLNHKKKFTTRIENLELTIVGHKKALNETPEPEQDSDELQERHDDAQRDFSAQEDAANEKEQLSRQLVRTERVYKEEQAEIEQLRQELEDHPDVPPMEVAQAEYDTAKEALVKVQQSMNLKKKSLKEGVCSECGRPLEGHDDTHDLAVEITDLQHEMEKLRPVVEERAEAYKLASTGQKVIDRLTSQVEVLEKPLATRLAEIDTLQGKIDALGVTLDEESLEEMSVGVADLQRRLTRFALDQQAYETAQNQVKDAEELLSQTQADMKELTIPDELDIDELGQELAEANASSIAAIDQHSVAVRERVSLEGVLSALKADFDRALKEKVTRDGLTTRLTTATSLQKYLRSNRDRFLSKVWGGVMGYSGSFASSCTAGEIEGVSRETDGGGFLYREQGEDFVVEAASGAQRGIMGLGIQMALSQLLPCGLKSVLLDEPTDSLDDSKALTLSAILASSDEQVIMISHRELDSSVAANTITLE